MEYLTKIAIIGGGAAGMMAAATASAGGPVVLLEKNDRLGKKLAITGNGRCNITHNTDVEGILDKTIANPYFLYSALYGLPPEDLVIFFRKLGVETKVEGDGRIFPMSDKAADIISALAKHLGDCGVEVRLNSAVDSINQECHSRFHIKLQNGKVIIANSCIIATGGLSYPATGSTGDGLVFARKLGHEIVDAKPALTPLVCSEKWVGEMMGLSFNNVRLMVYDGSDKAFDGVGELLFTHYGISGPLVLSVSAYVKGRGKTRAIIDLAHEIDKSELDTRILQYFQKNPNKNIGNFLGELLPKKLIPAVLRLARIEFGKKNHSITKEERARLVSQIKSLELNIVGNRGFKEAVITAGGVCVSQIDPSTMESKIVPNLYFAGEMIDVHALTGGYNLQIAFATGHLAGLSAAQRRTL